MDGIDPEHGITTSTIDEAKLTRRMMHAASQVIVLADSSKFGQRGFGRICALEDIDVIVTDERIPEQMISIIEEAGVDLIIVPIVRSPGRAVPGARVCRAGNPRTCAFRPAACGVRAAGRIRHVEKFSEKCCEAAKMPYLCAQL